MASNCPMEKVLSNNDNDNKREVTLLFKGELSLNLKRTKVKARTWPRHYGTWNSAALI